VKRLDDAPELLDGPLDRQILDGNLRDLARVNRWLGGTKLSQQAVAPVVTGLAAPSLLDVGTGAADIPATLAKALGNPRRKLTVTATDVRVEVVAAAASRVSADSVGVRLARLEDEADAAFDVVHASLVLHHLEPAATVSFLREMRRVARVAVVVNDLQRGRRWLAGAWLLTRLTTRNEYTRHDAPLSVRRAYTADEVVDLARQAGLRPVARYWARPAYRYALVFVHDRA
jgi:2-polyprenyl-3-methyl-5-hydroxy-6-metoxy-1,4-benzoquinol methylase